jgi:glycerol-3-phosphate acyltransferase PlsX
MNTLRIAIDAMGGDFGCQSILPAVDMAAKRYPMIEFHLYGDASIQAEMCTLTHPSPLLSNIKFIVSETSVAMDESPKSALRKKRVSSMGLAVQSVAKGKSHGCISAGNTGALVALGMHFLKCYKGLSRPALCKAIPVFKSVLLAGERIPSASTASGPKHSYLLDLGANVDCSAQQLQQFACLGAMLCSVLEQLDNPSVRLLNIGRETFKGSALIQEAAERCDKTEHLNYQGFVEADEIFQGVTDVIVCDGFSGNVALKASEGAVRIVTGSLKGVFTRNLFSRFLACLLRPVLRRWQDDINPDKYNGAYLLGLKGTVVKSHGSANAQQFFYALVMLIEQLQQQAAMMTSNVSSASASTSNGSSGIADHSGLHDVSIAIGNMDIGNMESVFTHTFNVSA